MCVSYQHVMSGWASLTISPRRRRNKRRRSKLDSSSFAAEEIACGYADGCLSKEQAVLIAYHCGRLTPVYGATDDHSPAMQPLAEELSRGAS